MKNNAKRTLLQDIKTYFKVIVIKVDNFGTKTDRYISGLEMSEKTHAGVDTGTLVGKGLSYMVPGESHV